MTSLELKRKEKKQFLLDNAEQERVENILRKAVDKESGKLSQVDAGITEDNPDGRECWLNIIPYLKKSYHITSCISS